MIYLIIFTPLFIFSLFATLTKNVSKYSDTIGLFFIVILSFIASIRYRVGTDFSSYESIWNGIRPLGEHQTYTYLEPGFVYFLSFLKLFSNSSVLFFSTMSILTLYILYKGIKKINNINIYVAIALYFMIFYMPYLFNGMRQALSMSIFIYSLTYIINGNFKKVLFLSLIATSFHVTGFLILISYFISKIKINLVYYFLLGVLISFLFYYFGVLGYLVDLLTPGKFTTYANSWGKTSFFQLVVRTMIAIFFIFSATKVIKNKFFVKTVMIYLIGYFIYISLADANMLATRFNMFFRVLEIILFSILLYQSKYLFNRIIFFIFTFIMSGSIFYLNISNPDNIYESIF